jgi:hypothetical protein
MLSAVPRPERGWPAACPRRRSTHVTAPMLSPPARPPMRGPDATRPDPVFGRHVSPVPPMRTRPTGDRCDEPMLDSCRNGCTCAITTPGARARGPTGPQRASASSERSEPSTPTMTGPPSGQSSIMARPPADGHEPLGLGGGVAGDVRARGARRMWRRPYPLVLRRPRRSRTWRREPRRPVGPSREAGSEAPERAPRRLGSDQGARPG